MQHSPFQAQFSASPGNPETWSGLHGSSLSLALLQAASICKQVTLVLTRSAHQSQLLAHDLGLLGDEVLPVRQFPDHETLPYDPFSPHPDIIAERLKTLSDLADMQHGLLLVPVSSLSQRLPPASYILQRSFELNVGQHLPPDAFRQRLVHSGYEHVEQVYRSGQFAVRGSVIDLYPSGSPTPYRLDLFDDEVDSIRQFDPESQRSTDKVEAVSMLPAREYPCDSRSLDEFRRAFRVRFDTDTRKVALYQDLRNGIHPQGLEQYLPLFYAETASLLDYLPGPPVLVIQQGAAEAARFQQQRTLERWEQRRHDIERPILEPLELFFSPDELFSTLAPLATVTLSDEAPGNGPPAGKTHFSTRPAPEIPIHDHADSEARQLPAVVREFEGRILFAADTTGRREVLRSALATVGIKPPEFTSFAEFNKSGELIGLAVLPIDEGFVIPDELALITETQLFGGRSRPKTRPSASGRDPEAIIRDLTDLVEGAPVVHEDHGVGRYLGLQTLDIDNHPAEFLMLEYAGTDKLYVPVSSLHLVSRYTGSDPEHAPLHRLGSRQWEKARKKAAEKVRDVAAELLDLHAKRMAREGYAFTVDDKLYNEFSAGFPFEETADQQQAIDAVIADMRSKLPTDRVVCGDVGFGKTEVALRAAFVAVQAGRQVAILVPTTLLAQQHFSTFSDRLADWPVRVEILSRFRSGAQQAGVLEQLQSGSIDIVIGTHRLIQKDIRFKKLGLVIIDEEQRFGVRQKERLKQLRAEVDLLTLTATPIPRTLNMAMSGIRDLSIIATPPPRRMAVKTLISEWQSAVLREALQREIQRGGQVFFLHNEVRSIDRIAREVQELAPQARIAIAHGQMPERELESVMLDFYRQKHQVLVCTTIIESGIDIPTANTIIINRADRFGLAQLHQLRGRVGRSHHQAYAYLIVPEKRSMTSDAKKRLEAIASLEELGAGFTLATHDLEIRGAGELLGAEQSGQINEVGFSMYSDLLARAVAALKKGEEPDLDTPLHRGIDVEFHVPALIPDDYLGDVQARLTLYKRIASAGDADELRDLQVEMIDRFGLLSQPIKNLFEIAELRLLAEKTGISRLDLGPQGGRLEFMADTNADPQALIRLIQSQSHHFKLDGPNKLRILAQSCPEYATPRCIYR
jgi:transcription-repair coupling factor (superfamily II helicase)